MIENTNMKTVTMMMMITSIGITKISLMADPFEISESEVWKPLLVSLEEVQDHHQMRTMRKTRGYGPRDRYYEGFMNLTVHVLKQGHLK